MGFFGKLLALPIKLVNAPIRAIEDLTSAGSIREQDRILSKPLDAIAKEVSKVDGEEE